MKPHAKIFRDEKGNRMIFRSLVQWGRDDDPSSIDLMSKAMMIGFATRLEVEEGWLEFDVNHFPHFETIALHRGFAHGGATALVFAGPEFEKLSAHQAV